MANGVFITKQETEIMQMIVDRKTLEQIGKKLSLTPRSIETYVAKLRKRLELNSTIDLVLYLLEKKIIKIK